MENNRTFQEGNTVYVASSEEVAVLKGMIIEIDDSCCPPHVGFIDSETKTRKYEYMDDVFHLEQEAKKKLETYIKTQQDELEKQNPMLTLFSSWMQQFPSSKTKLEIESMRKIIKEQYKVEITEEEVQRIQNEIDEMPW